MKKVICIDTETTGLDCAKHGIRELAYIIEIDGKAKEYGLFKINPLTFNKKVQINQKALDISHKTLEEITSSDYLDSKGCFETFIEILDNYLNKSDKEDKFTIVGYNTSFDIGFLKEWFKDNDIVFFNSYFSYKHLDVFALVGYFKYLGFIETSNDRLETICKYYNIPLDAHNALDDIQATKKLQGYDKVPNAPFKKNWAELGMKRMIQEAVENGYDKIAWTTGKQQAQRYSLEKELDTIVYNKNTGYIKGTKNGDEIVFKKVASDEEVSALLGKELTRKLIDPKSSTKDDIYVLSGEALKFGGDGMKAFYDNIVPNIVKKLFKKYKVKPKMEELDDIEEMVWSVDITPAMKEDIKKIGQPLYAQGTAGSLYGIDEDENGNITYDINKAIKGMIGATILGGVITGVDKKTLTKIMQRSKHTAEQINKEIEELDNFYNSEAFKKLSKEQQDVFETFFVNQKDTLIKKRNKNEFVKLIYGSNRKGAKKILVNHYGENTKGSLTKEDIINIAKLLNTTPKPGKHKSHIRTEYEMFVGKTRYRLIVEKDGKDEFIFNYFTNRK